MGKLKIWKTIQSKLSSLGKTEEQFIISKDSKDLYVDVENERIHITDFIEVADDTALLTVLAPITNKYYYVTATNKLWKYLGGEWVCVNKDTIYDDTELVRKNKLIEAVASEQYDVVTHVEDKGIYNSFPNEFIIFNDPNTIDGAGEVSTLYYDDYSYWAFSEPLKAGYAYYVKVISEPETTVDYWNNGKIQVLYSLQNIKANIDQVEDIRIALNNETTERANGDGALQDSLSDHMNDTSNPHSVTKSQVGLGNVPNVVTNDQTPTYEEASTLTTLTSGEKLATAFGKIKKAITDFISFKSSTNTALSAKAPTSHASTDITYGIGTSSNYGHVKLSDETNETSTSSDGIAATPNAVKKVYNKALIKKNTDTCDGIVGSLIVGDNANNSITTGKYTFSSGAINNCAGDYSGILGGSSNKTFGKNCAIVGGYSCIAYDYQNKIGRFAADGTAGTYSGTTGDVLSVGIGTYSGKKNGFRLDYLGNGYFYKAVSGTGADYAEMWEWLDGNPNSEDRVGYFVAFDGNKIRLANENDDLRKIGIISGNPAVIGDNFADDWQGMYLQDIYGRNITEHKSYNAEYDAEGNLIHEAYEADEFILNPDYNPDEKYIPRQQRKEWDAVGTHGKLVVRDDGSCQVNGFCKPTSSGIATASDNGFYVMERINDTHIRVYLR